MKKQAEIYCGGWMTETYDMPKLGERKEFRHDNGRMAKVSYWGKGEIIVYFFNEGDITSELRQEYKTLSQAADAVLAWNVAYRINY